MALTKQLKFLSQIQRFEEPTEFSASSKVKEDVDVNDIKIAFLSVSTKNVKSLHCWPTQLSGRAVEALADSGAAQGSA